MATIDWILIAWTLAFFALFGFLGLRYASARLWDWADVVYYPLTAIAAVLLFFSNDINRGALAAKAEQLRLERELHAHPNPAPDQNLGGPAPERLEEAFDFISGERELAKVCSGLATESCLVHRDHGEQIEKAFAGYALPRLGDDQLVRAQAVEAFCHRLEGMTASLSATPGLGDYGYSLVQRHWLDLHSFEDTPKAAQVLQAELASYRADVIANVRPQDRAFAGTILDEEAAFARNLFVIPSFCALRPKDQETRLAQIASWRREEARRAEQLERARSDVARAQKENPKSPQQQAVDWIRSRAWPFIVAVPLAVKFGKALKAFAKKPAGAASQPRTAFWRRWRPKKDAPA